MADATAHRHIYEQLSRRLAEVTEALFERAPFCRADPTAGPTRFAGTGARLAALCRGPARAATALQELEARGLALGTDPDTAQRGLREEWELALLRLLHELREPCSACGPGTALAGFAGLLAGDGCAVCARRAGAASEELERFAAGVDSPPAAAAAAAAGAPGLLQDERIRELERECQSYRETLEQAYSSAADEKAAMDVRLGGVEAAKLVLQQTCLALEAEVREAVDNIERLAEDLDVGMRWQTAQVAYATLHRCWQARRERLDATPEQEAQRREMELKALGFKHKQILALMRLGRYQDAEPMAKAVWDKRKAVLPDNAKEVRSISKDYCDILRRNGRHGDAEREYVMMWYTAMQGLDTEEDEWKLETASRIGEVMAEQARYSEAASWHRRVLDQRLRQVPLDVEKAAAAAIQCLSCHQLQIDLGITITDNTITDDLVRIWGERPPANEDENILICGHELGVRLQAQQKDEDAAAVLLAVWEKRKALGPRLLPECMATALSLVEVSVRTENLARLESLYHWVTQNPTPDQSENDQLWYRYRLACVQAMLEKWIIAEDNLRRVTDRQRQLFGADDADTLQFTQVLAEVLKRQDKNAEARRLLKPIWDGRQRFPRSVLQAILRLGHLYGDMIVDSGAPDEIADAEAMLKEVWDTTSSNIATHMPLMALVPSGDCFGMCLMRRGKFARAKIIFAQAVEWKRWLPMPQADIDRSSHLLGKATEWAARRPTPVYRPRDRVLHPMRLRDYLDAWYSTTVVTAAITET